MAEDQKPSLLIVDDDPLITDTLSYALSKDFEVLVADSRQNAVSLLRQLDTAPQLALVDLGLPPTPHRPSCPPPGRCRIRRQALRPRQPEEDPAARAAVPRRGDLRGGSCRHRPAD